MGTIKATLGRGMDPIGKIKLPLLTTLGSPGNNLPELRISLMLKPKSLKLCRGQPACGMPANGVRSQWKSKQNGFQMSFINQYTVVRTVMHINVQIRRLPHIFSRKLCIAHVLVTCMSQSKELSSNPGEMAPSCLEHMDFHSSLGYLVWSIFLHFEPKPNSYKQAMSCDLSRLYVTLRVPSGTIDAATLPDLNVIFLLQPKKEIRIPHISIPSGKQT